MSSKCQLFTKTPSGPWNMLFLPESGRGAGWCGGGVGMGVGVRLTQGTAVQERWMLGRAAWHPSPSATSQKIELKSIFFSCCPPGWLACGKGAEAVSTFGKGKAVEETPSLPPEGTEGNARGLLGDDHS